MSGIKNILIVAAIGAAGNLVRNLLLTSNDTHWPLEGNRHDTILKQYPLDLKCCMHHWWDIEDKLRFWKKAYNIDLNLSANFSEYSKEMITHGPDLPAVFINHSLVWGDNTDLDQFSSNTKMLYCAPTTEHGLEWQVRALHNKLGTKRLSMMDYTFQGTNRDVQVAKFIQDNSRIQYLKINKVNMAETLGKQQRHFKILAEQNNIPLLPLEQLITGNINEILSFLELVFDIELDIDIVTSVLVAWRSLHWPYEQTYDWSLNEFL